MIKERMKNLKTVNFEKNNEAQFYILKFSDRYFSTKLVGAVTTKCSVKLCTQCGLANVPNELESLKFELWGTREQLLYRNPWELVGTEKIIRIMEEYGIVGYQIKDIEVTKHKLSQKFVDGLKQIEIKGRVYAAYSSIGEELESCPLCGSISNEERFKTENGTVFKHEDWDGSDIFKLRTVGHIFVTDKFKNMIEKEEIKGFTFIPVKRLSLYYKLQRSEFIE